MLPKKIKRIPSRLIRELIISTIKMINSIRRKGGVYPVMSSRQIVTGRNLVLPPYPPGAFLYAVRGDLSNSVDKMRTFDDLYLQPNDEGGGHFVYNIDTMQRNSTCRVIGINNKPILIMDLMVDIINSQVKREPVGVEFTNIDSNTTLVIMKIVVVILILTLKMTTNCMRPVTFQY